MRYKFFILILAIVLFSNFTLASIELGNLSHEIEKSYTKLKPITGWVNFSLDNEPGDTLISGFGANITLREFVFDENNIACNVPGPYECSCFPSDCEPSYSTTGDPSTEKTYSINFISTQLFGIKLTENISQITNFRFNISTNAKDSCLNPLMIDLFDDNNIDFKVKEVSDEECFIEEPYGCYKSEDLEGNTSIGTDHLCGKITLPPLRGFKIGANIMGTGSATFILSLEDQTCSPITVTSGGEISCKIVLAQDLEEYTELEVCIYAESEGSKGNYLINFEDNDTCGFVEINGEPFPHDYEIFAKPLKYAAPSKINFNQGLFIDEVFNINTNVFDYIERKYNSECNPECIIPIRIYSGINQELTVSDLFVDYKVEGLDPGGSDENNFYNLNSIETLISSEFIKLDLPGIFLTPSTAGETDFILNIGDKTITQKISVIDIAEITSIIPNKAAFSVPTNFIIVLNQLSANTTYAWDFGDGTPIETTNTNILSHTYSALGSYQLKVNLSNNLGTTSKTVNVNVLAPYDAINDTISEYKARLKTIDNSLFVLPDWIQTRILNVLNINDLKSNVNSLEGKYKELFETEEEELVKIMTSLNALNIPFKLDTSLEIKSSKFTQNRDRFNPLILEEFGAGNLDIEREEEYYSAVNRWLEENLDINIESKTYSFFYTDQTEQTALSHITVRLKPKTDIDEFYMIIEGDTNNIKFLDDHSEREIDPSNYGLRFSDLVSGGERKIEFSYPESIEVFNLPLYVSPEFRNLELGGFVPGICNNNNICEENLGENSKNCRVDCKPWKLTFLFFVILFVTTFVVYVVLQEWYKRNYESHLFKNKNQLFNLIAFMNNGINQKLTRNQIFAKLKPLGWNDEQLNYAWRKLHGKRTGMWEIPIFISFEKRKVKKEIEKRKSMAIGTAKPSTSPSRPNSFNPSNSNRNRKF